MRVELPYPMRPYQREAWAALKRFSVLVWHRRAGKTVFAIKRLVVAALASKQGMPRYGYVAPYYRQARAVAWDYLRRMLEVVPGVQFSEVELQATLPNGARIKLFGADNPDSLRGLYFDGVVLDEVADMRPQIWGEILRPALADRQGWALFIGTPKGINLFSERYYAAQNDDEWYADLRRASETGAIEDAELARARREMTASQWAQEMECDFAAAVDNALIPLNFALEAARRELLAAEYTEDAKILGIDVARYGDDRTVACYRQGRRCHPLKVWRGIDLMTTAANVARIMDEVHPHAVFIDETGLGSGVVDRLRQLGRRVVGVNFGAKAAEEKFQNKRVEMWWLLAEWIKTASIPNEPELISELTAPTYTYANAAGRLQLESKEDLRERGLPSPDLADALALTFAEPVAHPGLRSHPSHFRVQRAVGA